MPNEVSWWPLYYNYNNNTITATYINTHNSPLFDHTQATSIQSK